MAQEAKSKGYATVSAVVTRADGKVEDLGIISDTRKLNTEPEPSILKKVLGAILPPKTENKTNK